MGEAVGILIAIAILGIVLGGTVLGIVAFALLLGTRRRVADMARRLDRLAERPPAEVPEVPPPPPPPIPEPERPEPDEAAPAPSPPETSPALPDQAPGEQRGGLDWARIEEVVGTRWMTWAGVLALFFAVAFTVKYAFEQGWIGPTTRVVLGIVSGLAMLGAGDRTVRRNMRAFGQTLMGGGLAMLYASLFGAFAVYHLVPQPVAFAAMVLVTAGGMTLSVMHDALAISFMAVLGGVLTPVLLSTGVDARDALFSYLLLLDLGVMGVALFRRWRALDALAFAGTAALFAAWFCKFYEPPAMVPALLWLGAFYLVFLLLPFVHHLRHGQTILLERMVMGLANATLAFTCAYVILRAEHRHVLGFVALAMAACYVGLATQVRRRIPGDSRGLLGMAALAVALLTLAVPLHLKLEGITLAWAVEAPLLVYLGYRYRYRPVRSWAVLALIAAGVRAFATSWPLHSALFTPVCNRPFGTAMAVAVAAGVLALVHRLNASEATPLDHGLKRSVAIAGGLFALLHVHAEADLYFRLTERLYLARCAVMVVWAVGALAYLGAGLRLRSVWARRAGLLPLVVGCALAARAYGSGAPEGYVLFLNVRFAAALAAAAAVFCYGFLLRRCRDKGEQTEGVLGAVLLWAGALALLALLSAEAYCWCESRPVEWAKAEWTALMSLSLVWGLYAAAMLAVGFWRRILPLRLAALGLFAATALKLVAIDIANVKQVYRIISFLVLGALMVGAAYVYHRVERRFEEWVQRGS